MCAQARLLATGQVLTASAQHSSEAATAQQQAALDLVHKLQQAILAMLTASQPDKAATMQASSTDHSSAAALQILHEGDVQNSMPEIGNVVKVQYELVHDLRSTAPAGPSKEGEEGTTASPGVGGMMPASDTCMLLKGLWQDLPCMHLSLSHAGSRKHYCYYEGLRTT